MTLYPDWEFKGAKLLDKEKGIVKWFFFWERVEIHHHPSPHPTRLVWESSIFIPYMCRTEVLVPDMQVIFGKLQCSMAAQQVAV